MDKHYHLLTIDAVILISNERQIINKHMIIILCLQGSHSHGVT